MTLRCQASASCPSCTQWKDDASWIYFAAGGANYRNPIQGGCYYDCSLMAAMASIAWVNPNFFEDKAGPEFSFTFYPDGSPTAVGVNRKLIVNSNQLYCGATSYRFPSTKEIWPAIIEKAFAKLCIQRKWPTLMNSNQLADPAYWPSLFDTSNPLDPYWANPIYIPNAAGDGCWGLSPSNWGGGNPVITMDWLAGCLNSTVLPLYQPLSNGCPNRNQPNFANLYEYIKANFCNEAAGKGKTKNPLAAWTYSKDECLPAGYSFSPTGIQKDHSYSILGIKSPNYIILRVPCGINPSLTSLLTTGTYSYINGQFTICKKDGRALSTTIGKLASLTLQNSGGVFGITYPDFMAYFEAFGWIQ